MSALAAVGGCAQHRGMRKFPAACGARAWRQPWNRFVIARRSELRGPFRSGRIGGWWLCNLELLLGEAEFPWNGDGWTDPGLAECKVWRGIGMARAEEASMEPSMEEILASIRKIIAEEPADGTRPRPVERKEPVLPAGDRDAASQGAAPRGPDAGAAIGGNAQVPRDERRDHRTGAEPRRGGMFDEADPFAGPAQPHGQPASPAGPLEAADPSPEASSPPPSSSPSPGGADAQLLGRLSEALRAPAPRAMTPDQSVGGGGSSTQRAANGEPG